MRWAWRNYTQVVFGVGSVAAHIPEFISPNSRVLCTFGGGSIDSNNARRDVQSALDSLSCITQWEGGILANPEYDRLLEILSIIPTFKPDLLLAVGGGSVIDGTKFLAAAAKLPPGTDPWQSLFVEFKFPPSVLPVGCVLTLPASGSEWNPNFVISRRSIQAKLSSDSRITYPKFSILDPSYTMTAPVRQIRNGVFDGIAHCIDQFLTGQENVLMDGYWLTTMKELVTIGPEVAVEDSGIELRSRWMVACSFALNEVFTLGKEGCWAVHMIGHELTAKWGIDHGASLAMVAPPFLETQIGVRRKLLAKTAQVVFEVVEGGEEEKARACIEKLREFVRVIGLPERVGQWPGVVIAEGDVEEVTERVWTTVGQAPFGWQGVVTKQNVLEVLTQVIRA
jgi:alcohol dehydrogenase YqhD (iron-dependent ADH family)